MMTLTEAVKRLKKLGLKVVEQERTEGAIKRWLRYPGGAFTTREEFAAFRLSILQALEIDPKDLYEDAYSRYVPLNRGHGIDVTFQTEAMDGFFGLFIAVPTRTKTGKEYLAGIDC